MKKVALEGGKTATFIDYGVYEFCEFYGGNFWGYEI